MLAFLWKSSKIQLLLYSLIHMTAGSFLSSDTDSVESIFHRTVVKKRARMQRGEGVKDEKGYDVVVLLNMEENAGLPWTM